MDFISAHAHLESQLADPGLPDASVLVHGPVPAGSDRAKYNPAGLKDSRAPPVSSPLMDLPFLHPDQPEFIPIRRGGGPYVDKTDYLRSLIPVRTLQQDFSADVSIGLLLDRIGGQPWILATALP